MDVVSTHSSPNENIEHCQTRQLERVQFPMLKTRKMEYDVDSNNEGGNFISYLIPYKGRPIQVGSCISIKKKIHSNSIVVQSNPAMSSDRHDHSSDPDDFTCSEDSVSSTWLCSPRIRSRKATRRKIEKWFEQEKQWSSRRLITDTSESSIENEIQDHRPRSLDVSTSIKKESLTYSPVDRRKHQDIYKSSAKQKDSFYQCKDDDYDCHQDHDKKHDILNMVEKHQRMSRPRRETKNQYEPSTSCISFGIEINDETSSYSSLSDDESKGDESSSYSSLSDDESKGDESSSYSSLSDDKSKGDETSSYSSLSDDESKFVNHRCRQVDERRKDNLKHHFRNTTSHSKQRSSISRHSYKIFEKIHDRRQKHLIMESNLIESSSIREVRSLPSEIKLKSQDKEYHGHVVQNINDRQPFQEGRNYSAKTCCIFSMGDAMKIETKESTNQIHHEFQKDSRLGVTMQQPQEDKKLNKRMPCIFGMGEAIKMETKKPHNQVHHKFQHGSRLAGNRESWSATEDDGAAWLNKSIEVKVTGTIEDFDIGEPIWF